MQGRPPIPSLLPVAGGAAGPPIRMLVDGLEVTQAVQDMARSVPLVAGKLTVVRIYLSVESSAPVQVRGQLSIGVPGGPKIVVLSSNAVTVNPAQNGQLQSKRENVGLSLNFSLPPAQTSAGPRELSLANLTDVTTGSSLTVSGAGSLTVQFQQTPSLRVRILALKYTKAGSLLTYEPSALDYALIESWLRRAYPVPDVIFSRVVVSSNYTWPFDADQSNAQVAAIRRLDMAAGADPLTHYFGLVADGGGANFMRGKAAGIPQVPDPSTVASGPTGSNTWGWDFDGSYGDWYTGHELGHTFGRYHPGFCNGNSADDPHFPYPNGQLAHANGDFVGFDVGDPTNGIAAAALPGIVWHDIMTYCDYQWLSAYTYIGIRARLVAENSPGPSPGGGVASTRAPGPTSEPVVSSPPSPKSRQPVDGQPTPHINVVGVVNLTKQTGKIEFVHPVDATHVEGAVPNSSVSVRFRADDTSTLSQAPVELRLGSCPMPGEDLTGLIDAVLSHDPKTHFIDLLLNDAVLDTFAAAGVQPRVSNIRRAAAELPSVATLAWDTEPMSATTVTYTVQASTDGGNTWQTIAVRQPSPSANVDLSQFRPAKSLLIRVIASDGFTSHVSQPHTIDLN